MLGNPIASKRTTLRLFGQNRQTLEPPNFRTAKRVSCEKTVARVDRVHFQALKKNAKDMRSLADFLFLSEFASKE